MDKQEEYNKFVIRLLKMIISNIKYEKYLPYNVEFNVGMQKSSDPHFQMVYKTKDRTLILHFIDEENR